MRVLLLHNRYRAEGGEERAVSEIATLLRSHGHEVETLERTSADVAARRAAAALLHGGLHPDGVGAAVTRLRADVVHAHNIHPLFGWRALAAAREAGARTILHLHNFRLFCAIGVAYRDGAVCFRCRGANTLPGVRLRCRGSLGEAAVYGAGLHLQQPRLFEHADRFIAVSEATAGRLIELGLPGDRTTALPNFVSASSLAAGSAAHKGEYALVAGRLVEEKGFDTAVAACRAAGVPLVVAGDGPDEPRLRSLAGHGHDPGPGSDDGAVRFTGRLPPDQLRQLRRRAAMTLVPSRWEEPCPYAVLDALADGVPVLASDRGGMPELVGREHVLPPSDTDAWTRAIAELWTRPALRRDRGKAGLVRARDQLGEQRYHDTLMRVYDGGRTVSPA
jgi:glycosyltransferase involved in cell wall biosynthesis